MLEARITEEFGKLKGNLKHLWSLSTTKKVDRDACKNKNILLEIRKSQNNMVFTRRFIFGEDIKPSI